MDPVSLIVAALVAGAADSASQAVRDAYLGFKRLLLGRIGDQSAARVAVEQHEKDPDTWAAPVAKAVIESGAGADDAVLDAARRLLELADPGGTHSGQYTVNITASGERSVAAHTIAGSVSTGDNPQAR